ncbi:hypothetical protein F5Y07DRAFT_393316 [Xylaria sp. FL0933]|nr:hypothetical protein F5Y07DRAFT_393316 [Xylaria sp. FL0933]
MAHDDVPRPSSTTSSEAHAQQLYDSLEKYNQARRKRKRPSVILTALIALFISSAGGITLAIVLMVKVAEIEAACFARDFILFAGLLSLLYICLHICAARRDYKRIGPRPPQMYGQYLHASAVLVARLGIVTWVMALGATVVVIALDTPLAGISAKIPFFNLLLCMGAIPSFLLISVTIERKSKPFATTSISRASFLTCRVSQFADDLSADSSVSRRSSLRRKQSHTGSILTLPTDELFMLGTQWQDEKPTGASQQQDCEMNEKRASLHTENMHQIPSQANGTPSTPAQLTTQTPDSTPGHTVPQPTYCPGGWRAEWNSVAQEVGVPQLSSKSTDESSSSETSSPPQPSPPQQPSPPNRKSQETPAAAPSAAPPRSSSLPQKSQLPPTPNQSIPTTTSTQKQRYSQNFSTASWRWSGSVAPSNLSTVRYASEPEIAVQQSIRVVRNPAYRPRAVSAGTNEGIKGAAATERPIVSRPDAALLRDKQPVQKPETEKSSVPKRTPSNFSRPLQKDEAAEEKADNKVADAEGDMKIPGAFVEDGNT